MCMYIHEHIYVYRRHYIMSRMSRSCSGTGVEGMKAYIRQYNCAMQRFVATPQTHGVVLQKCWGRPSFCVGFGSTIGMGNMHVNSVLRICGKGILTHFTQPSTRNDSLGGWKSSFLRCRRELSVQTGSG